VTNDFLSSIVQNFAVIEHEGQDQKMKDVGDFYILGKGKFELVKQANRLRQELAKSGRKMRLLEVMLNSVSKKGDKNNIQLFMGFENASPDKDHLTENFRELLRNPETRNFATALISTGIIQSGYSKSPLFFSDIIPEEFITPILTKANDRYIALTEKDQELYAGNFAELFKVNEGFLFGNRGGVPEAYRYKNYEIKYFFELDRDVSTVLAPVEPVVPSPEVKGGVQPTQPTIEISQSKYTRDSVESDPDIMYLFTDNAERTSAPSASTENVNKNSWYYKKYKSQTNKPIHFGTLNNPTSAVIRGLNNAYPISTMSAYGTNWTDDNFDLFKQVVDDEINQIKQDLPKFKSLKIGDFRIGQGGLKAKLPLQHQEYLDSKLKEIGIDNTGVNPKITKPTQEQPTDIAEIERLQQSLDSLKLTLETMDQESSPVMQVMDIIKNTKFKPDSIKKETGYDVGSSKEVLPFLTSKSGKSIPKLAEEISELERFENTGITYDVVFDMIVDYVSNPKSFNTKTSILKEINRVEKQLDKLAPLQKFKKDDTTDDCSIPF
jgi:hypothetical protein